MVSLLHILLSALNITFTRDEISISVLYRKQIRVISISESFVCPTYHFKCPRSFCIESQYVCDGILQCKDGQDEENCSKYKCFLLDFNTGSPLGMLSKLRLFSFLFWLRNEKNVQLRTLIWGPEKLRVDC